MSDQLQVPFTLARNLPVYTGDIAGLDFVSVSGNGRTVRTSAADVLSGVVHWHDGFEPSSSFDAGESGTVAVGACAFYVYYNGAWGKVPMYSSNWDDIEPGTRFLRVDKPMDLSVSEKANVAESIGLSTASSSHAGLVTAEDGEGPGHVFVSSTGRLSVPQATPSVFGTVTVDNEEDSSSVVSMGYLDARLDNREKEEYHIATHETPGMVRADSPEPSASGYVGPFQVDDTGNVTIKVAEPGDNVNPGLVRLSSSSLEDSGDEVSEIMTAASLYRTRLMIADAINTQAGRAATESALGSVVVPGDGAVRVITDTTPIAERPESWRNGCIDVSPADDDKHGAVVTASSIQGSVAETARINGMDYYVVPTAAAVKAAVTDLADNVVHLDRGKVPADMLPKATQTSLGGVMLGYGITVGSNGSISPRIAVPTIHDTVVPSSGQSWGTVYACCNSDEVQNPPIVPTVRRVESMIVDVVSGSSGLSLEYSWPIEAAALDPITKRAILPAETGKVYTVDKQAVGLYATPFTDDWDNKVREYMVLWTTGQDAVLQHSDDGLAWDKSRTWLTSANRVYLIRVRRVGQSILLAAVDSYYSI